MSQPALHGTACKVCRRRGRKCDRTLPTCLSCNKRGVECEGYVTRWPGVAARGKLAGKSIPVVGEKPVSVAKPKSAKGHNHQGRKPRDTGMEPWMLNQNHGPQSEIPETDHFDECDIDKLVQHYIDDLSGIFYLGEGPSQNPLFQYVLPWVDTVPPIRYALAASAACHTAARNSDRALDQKSLSLRVHATSLMGDRLLDQNLTTLDTMIPSILMLAQLDMCSGDCVEFEIHLKAGVELCRDARADHVSNSYYFEQRLAWLDIISSTTSTRMPFFTHHEFLTSLGRISKHGKKVWSYDVFPCPIELCEMLIDTIFLSKICPTDPDEPSDQVLEKARGIESRLHTWTELVASIDDLRNHLVQSWRLGILAYLRRLFPSLQTGQRSTRSTSLATQLLRHAQSIPERSSRSYPLLWPIFQVAVTLDDSALGEKGWIRSYLMGSLDAVGCRHFSNALDVLEEVWMTYGKAELPATGTFGRTIVLG